MHEFVDVGQLAEADDLVRGIDEAASEKVNGLGSVLAVADVAALDGDHADDSLEHGGLEVGLGGQADADDGAVGANVLRSLLEGQFGDGEENDGFGAVAVGRGGLDIGDQVLAGGVVDIGSGTEREGVFALLVAAVNGNDVQAHGLGVLDGHVTETATGTDNSDKLAGASVRLLEALVDGDTGTQDGGHGLEGHLLGEAGYTVGIGDAVLLEGAVDGIARKSGLFAKWLIHLTTEGAVEARAVDPLDADVVADGNIFDEVTAGDDNTGAFVATDQGHLSGQGPVAQHGVQVSVADTRVLDVDEDLIGARFADRNLFVDGRYQSVSANDAYKSYDEWELSIDGRDKSLRLPDSSTTCAHCSEGMDILMGDSGDAGD